MTSISTKNALGRRAIHAASTIEYWHNQLWEEIKKQNELWSSIRDLRESKTPITLPLGKVTTMLDALKRAADEIRRFEAAVPRS